MKSLAAWLRARWFAPEPALNLAAARVVFSAHALWMLLSRDLASTSALPGDFFSHLTTATKLRFGLFPGHAGLEHGIQAIAISALILAILGVRPRLACFVAGLALYHLAPLETLFWTPNAYERGHTVNILALLALSSGPCGDALALYPRPSPGRAPEPAYGATLRMAQLCLVQVYVLAGLAKLRRAGLAWVSADNLHGWLLLFQQQDQIRYFTELGPRLAASPVACWAMAIGAVTMDLSMGLLVLLRRGRWLLVGLAMVGHAGILLSMNIAFLNVPQLLVFLDWEWIARQVRDRRLRAP